MRSTALPSGPVVDLTELREALATTTDVAGLAVPGYAFVAAGLGVFTLLLLGVALRRRAARRAAAATSDPIADSAAASDVNATSPLVHSPQVSSGPPLEPGLAQHPAPETIPPVGPVFAGPGNDLPGTLSAPETTTPAAETADPWMELQEQSATYLTGGPASNPDLVAHPISGDTAQRRRRGTPDPDAVPVARQGSRAGHQGDELTHESVDEVLIPDLPPGSHTRPDTADWLPEQVDGHDASEVAEQAQAWLESLTLQVPDDQDTDEETADLDRLGARPVPAAPEPTVQTHITTWTPPGQPDRVTDESGAAADNQTETVQGFDDPQEPVLTDEGPTVTANEDIEHDEVPTPAAPARSGPDAQGAHQPAQATSLKTARVEEGSQAHWSEQMLAILSTAASAPLQAAANRTTQPHDKVVLLLAAAAAHTHEGDQEQALVLIQQALEHDVEVAAAVPGATFKVPLDAQYSVVLLPVTDTYARLWLTAYSHCDDQRGTDLDVAANAELICALVQFNARRLAGDDALDPATDTAETLGLQGGVGKRTRVDEWTVLAAHARLLAAPSEERAHRGHQLRGTLAAWRTTPTAPHRGPAQLDHPATEVAEPSVVLGTAQMHTDVIAAITGR